MPNWTSLINAQHRWAHDNDGYQLVLNGAADEVTISALNDKLGIRLAPEFCDFYRCHDGFGVRHTSDPETVHWSLVPLSQVSDLIQTARDWFQETHPELAKTFFPFIDWSCGDYTGYIIGPDGTFRTGLFTFEHESYEFEPDQTPDDFLHHSYDDIADYLSIR